MTQERWRIIHADCREALRELSDCSVDAIVTDPPYELGFMGKAWDATGIAYSVDVWRECLRVLKHGGHLLAFGGSRTYHRLAVAIEDAGFQIRDQIMWVYGSGFPKSLDVSKAIDKQNGIWRGRAGAVINNNRAMSAPNYERTPKGEPITDAAKQWEGWGTALKPAHEPIVLARKALDGTVAQNVLWHGVGGLNIDACRVRREQDDVSRAGCRTKTFGDDNDPISGGDGSGGWEQNGAGRFPANFIHDGSDEIVELFPETASTGNGSISGNRNGGGNGSSVGLAGVKYAADGYADGGSAARFFYCAKANKKDRNEGLDDFPLIMRKTMSGGKWIDKDGTVKNRPQSTSNHHPTVKPTTLMRYLCRLITPPAGLVLDPFTGSGSTGKAAMLEGFNFIGIEQQEEYVRLAEARIHHAENNQQ